MAGAEDLYDSFKIDHDDCWSLPLPSRAQTLAYMQRVYDAVLERLQGHDPSAAETYLYLLSILHGICTAKLSRTCGRRSPTLNRSLGVLGPTPWILAPGVQSV